MSANPQSADDIDAMAVARRILSSPKTFRVSTLEELAMAGCLIGLDQTLDELERRPAIGAALAASIAQFIKVETIFHEQARSAAPASSEIWNARERAFNALKTAFEKEFPNV